MHRRRLATATILATATTPLFAAAQSAEPPTNLTVARVRHVQPAGAAEVDLTWWWFGEQGPNAVGFTIQWVATAAPGATTCPSSFPALSTTNTHYEARGNKRAATIRPLNCQKTYCFRIRTDAVDDDDDSAWSTDVAGPIDLREETTLGLLPEPSVTADFGGHNQVRLSVSNARCEVAGKEEENTAWKYAWRDVLDDWEDVPSRSGRLSTVDSQSTGSQTVTVNMTNGRSYVFRVRYHCHEAPVRYSSWSFESDIVTPRARFTPGPPTNVRLTANDTTLTLSWDEPNTGDYGSIAYEVQFRRDGGPWSTTGVSIDGTSATLTGVRGSSYRARVLAKSGDANSPWLQAGPETVPEAPTPGPPTGVEVYLDGGHPAVTWQPPRQCGRRHGHRLRGRVPHDRRPLVAERVMQKPRPIGPQMPGPSAVAGQVYEFRVRALSAEGAGDWNESSAVTVPGVLTPTGLRAVGGNSSCRLSWNPPETAPRSYDIERRGQPPPKDAPHNWVVRGRQEAQR